MLLLPSTCSGRQVTKIARMRPLALSAEPSACKGVGRADAHQHISMTQLTLETDATDVLIQQLAILQSEKEAIMSIPASEHEVQGTEKIKNSHKRADLEQAKCNTLTSLPEDSLPEDLPAHDESPAGCAPEASSPPKSRITLQRRGRC